MFQPQSGIKQLLYSTLLILLWIHTVFGDDQDSRLDVLKGDNGETPCTLKTTIYKGCNLSPPSTSNATFETPGSCTCNRIFFNIWSACSYSTGENIFPLFKDWMTICTNAGINLEQSQSLADSNTWGVDAPKWATILVPGNETIDLQRAVLATRSNWSVLQILLPCITALVAVFVTVLIMQLYHSHDQKASWRDRMRRLVRPIPKVKNVEKYDSWEIEANDHDGSQYELVAPPSSTSDAYTFGPQSPQQVQAQRQSLHRGGHSKTDSETFDVDTESGWGSLRNMRLPWKKSPNRVQEVNATTEFDIDDYNGSTTTVGLTNDGENMDSQRRSARIEGEDSGSSAGQAAPGNPQSTISKDYIPYSDPFSEQRSHR